MKAIQSTAAIKIRYENLQMEWFSHKSIRVEDA